MTVGISLFLCFYDLDALYLKAFSNSVAMGVGLTAADVLIYLPLLRNRIRGVGHDLFYLGVL